MTTATLFRTSINVNYDIGETEFLKNYLPTPSHAESIIGLSEGFLDRSASSSHIMIGPYGSGKSLLATVMASLVSRKVNNKYIDLLIRKFVNVHQDVYESLSKLNNLDKRYVPVVLNGSYENFNEALIYAIENVLEKEGIKINLPTVKNSILETLNEWEKDFPTTFHYFKQILIEYQKDYNQWVTKIKNNNSEEITWFKKVYPKLTAGAIFHPAFNGDLIESLEYILHVLKKNKIGIFIIYDEFGRLLQNIEHDQVYKVMQDLQDLAEFTDRSEQFFQLLLISHKGMSQYMLGLNEVYQSEFQRIEKRYASYYVESDTATFYRIVNKYLEDSKERFSQVSELQKETMNYLRRFNLFQNLNQHEIEHLVVKGCYPIHPMTLFLLPRISKVFGQNERTLFTYLESSHSYGFQTQIEKSNNYIFADTLFNYFFTEEVFQENHDETTRSIINTYQIIRGNLDARKLNAHRIIKFITMWEITNSNNVYKLDYDLIQFATNIETNRLDEIIDELTELKLIRYNRIQDKWELSEGSSVVIDDLIKETRPKLRIDNYSRINKISSLLKNKYYLSRNYNDEKNITRFMRVRIISDEILLTNIFRVEDLLENNSDGTICYILVTNYQHIEKVSEFIKKIKHPQLIFGMLHLKVNKIVNVVDDLITINELLDQKQLLIENKHLKDELNLIKKDQEYEIEKFLNHFNNFDKNVEWFYKGKNIFIRNHVDMENKLSEIMYRLYSKTPIIMNDSVNRFHVIGIQKRSLYELVDRVLNNAYKENLGIEGHGPDYLIYATVIKNQKINIRELDSIDNPIFKEIREKLIDHLEKNNKGTVLDLYNILNCPPYGIRPPLVPLILITLLKDKWDQLMFYRNEIFVPALKGEKIYEMFKEAEKYQYVYHDFSTSIVDFMNKVESEIDEYISENVLEETQLIRVSSGLLNWLRSLPRQVQITENLDDELQTFKTIIRRSEINPLQSLEELISLFNNDPNSLKRAMNKLEGSHEIFKENLLRAILDLFNKSSLDELKKDIGNYDKNLILKNRLLNVIVQGSSIEEITYYYLGTKLEEWSDVNYELFINQIKSDYQEMNNSPDRNQNVNDNQIELILNNTYKPVQKVKLSARGEMIYTNVNRILENAGRSLAREEIEYLVYKLIEKHIE